MPHKMPSLSLGSSNDHLHNVRISRGTQTEIREANSREAIQGPAGNMPRRPSSTKVARAKLSPSISASKVRCSPSGMRLNEEPASSSATTPFRSIAEALNVSRAEIHGVLTSDHDFCRAPAGRHLRNLPGRSLQSCSECHLPKALLPSSVSAGWHHCKVRRDHRRTGLLASAFAPLAPPPSRLSADWPVRQGQARGSDRRGGHAMTEIFVPRHIVVRAWC